jgi:hypothetical protein
LRTISAQGRFWLESLMFWFYLILIVSIFVLYHLAVIIYYSVKSGLAQADELEQQFGSDIIGAFKHQFRKNRDR